MAKNFRRGQTQRFNRQSYISSCFIYIISNYNSSREYDDSNKIISSKNYTLNEMTAGFDFFDNNKKLVHTSGICTNADVCNQLIGNN